MSRYLEAVHDFELLPPPDEPEGGAAPADREPSMQEILDMLESLSVNIKTFENDPMAGAGAEENADDILNSPASESGAGSSSTRRTVHRKERSRVNSALQASFTQIPSMSRSGSFGRRGDADADAEEHKLVGTLLSEIKIVARNFAQGFTKMIGRAREGAEDEEAKLRQIEDIIGERLRRGTLKPPALGEGTLREDAAAFLTDEIPFRINRALFIKVLMILEYLRLKEAGDADPFWATARGRTMLMEHTLLRRLDPIPGNVDDGSGGGGGGSGGGSSGLSSADVAAHLAAVRYYEALLAYLKQREGEPDLDMNAAGQDPLTQLGSQVSSYSAVFSM